MHVPARTFSGDPKPSVERDGIKCEAFRKAMTMQRIFDLLLAQVDDYDF